MSLNNHLLKAFGNRIRHIRTEQGISQEKLAEKAGLHRTYIGMIERGEKNITLLNIIKISSALNIDLKNLFEFDISFEKENNGH